MTSSLKGIRVLDLTRVLAGPVCTQILGDLGADIIKIERPGTGDDTRGWGPPFLKDKEGNDTSESAYYLSANRNKRSVTIDISTKEGQDLIHQLAEKSDVLIENFKVGGLDKYGLGYNQLKDKNPKLIYAAISGFGQNGPLAKEPGYDFLAQALSGLMASTGEPDGQPMKVGVALGDVMTGLYTTIGILSALHYRDQTGKGQMVDVSLLDTTLSGLTNLAQYYLTAGKPAPRMGNAHSTIVPYQTFETLDGHIVIAVGNDGQFTHLCHALKKDEWARDDRFARNSTRVTHRDTLIPLLSAEIKKKSTQEWMDMFQQIDVPAAPVNRMDDVFKMDQIAARGMKISLPHPLSSIPIDLVGSPLKLSDTPVTYNCGPPTLGQHTEEVLKDMLQLGSDDINELRKKGVV